MTTKRLGQFFQEIGRPATGNLLPVTSEDLMRFAEISASHQDKEAYPKLGERHFIAKPVSNHELIRRINEMLTTNDIYTQEIQKANFLIK